jgi:hypothetical protein
MAKLALVITGRTRPGKREEVRRLFEQHLAPLGGAPEVADPTGASAPQPALTGYDRTAAPGRTDGGAIAESGLVQDAVDVILDGTGGDKVPSGDLAVRQSGRDQPGDLALALR